MVPIVLESFDNHAGADVVELRACHTIVIGVGQAFVLDNALGGITRGPVALDHNQCHTQERELECRWLFTCWSHWF